MQLAHTCTILQVPAPDVAPPKIDKQLATPPKEPNASRRRARSPAPQAAAQAEDGDGLAWKAMKFNFSHFSSKSNCDHCDHRKIMKNQ